MTKNVNQTIKDVAIIPRKTITELINETDANIYYTLKNSIYPGAKDESIGMVIAACHARNYPILAKCYHIVPMNVKNAITGVYEWRDTIMMGINAYRIEADRAESYLGLTEPEYGPIIKETLGGKDIEYPEWCKIVASKILPNGQKADFPVIEYWKENYATKGKDSIEANQMWTKRPRAQLAKCTEAQALRRAFPDILGANTTYEEMDGKIFKDVKGERLDIKKEEVKPLEYITPDQLTELNQKIVDTKSDTIGICSFSNISHLEEMTTTQFVKVCKMLDQKALNQKATRPMTVDAEKEPGQTENIVDEFLQGLKN